MTKFAKKTKMVHEEDLAPWHSSNIIKDSVAKLKMKVLDWARKCSELNQVEITDEP